MASRPRPDGSGATPVRASSEAQNQRIYQVVRAIPRGKVASYGQLAMLAGIPRGHRVAARALQTCPSKLPWQRVVAKKDARRAQISIQDPEHAALQRDLLEAEGVVFDDQGLISLRDHGWLPSEAAAGKAAGRT